MKFEPESVKSKDGLNIYLRNWQPEVGLKGVVCLVHGLGEHSGRYEHLAEFLTRNGYGLSAFDLRGHGKSEGQRGHFPTIDHPMDDIAIILDRVADHYTNVPIFLFGHSLGGGLVLYYVLLRKPNLAGAIVTSPALRSALEKQILKLALVKYLSAVAPRLSIPSGLKVDDLSRDKAVTQAYRDDPLVHNQGTLQLANEYLKAVKWVFSHASELSLPLLLMYSTNDLVTIPSSSQQFAEQVGEMCTVKKWEGLYHELHNEPEKETVFRYLLDWLDHVCQAKIPS